MFNNAPSHIKHAPNAISATKMVKSSFYFIFLFYLYLSYRCPQDPKHLWMPHPNGPRMRNGVNPLTGEHQPFYFPDDHPTHPGWFKGMEQIIHERRLWPESGLPAKCTGPKRPKGHVTCCCHHLFYSQANFKLQKPQLQEHIKSHGHLCDFYPKYHCELNFIEQYWDAAKLQFHIASHARTIHKMERKMLECLDNIPLDQIQRCITFFFLFWYSNLFSGLLTGLHGLFQHTVKVCLVPKQHGPIESTMAIASCPPI